MSYKLTLEIPELPQSLNKGLRTYYKQRDKINKYWYEIIYYEVGRNRPQRPLEKALITIQRHSSRFLDYDNCVASMKPIIDGLVHARVLIDDSYKVTGPWNVTQEFRKKKLGPFLLLIVESRI